MLLPNEFIDMFSAGIVDPAKVTRLWITKMQPRSLVWSLTTECIVVDKPEKRLKLLLLVVVISITKFLV